MSIKIISWNVNGIRAAIKKDFVQNMQKEDPDILCIQETKAQDEEVLIALDALKGYHIYINSAEKKGYSGTTILSKKKPILTEPNMGVESHDQEGRILAAEYDKYFLVNVYVPNSGRGLVKLDYRQKWDADFCHYLENLHRKKPVIVCGDFNVAHQPIDLARPKSNYNKTAGYTQAEIDGFSHFLSKQFIDVFRHLYPDELAYSWWSYMYNARAKNIGWRIDYFLASEALLPDIKGSYMLSEVMGSDHCPVVLELS
jgi:exodeoxyribonuclease-3